MLSNIWMLSAVVTPAGTINQVVDQNLDPQIAEILEGADGAPDTQFSAIAEEKPILSFSTTALAASMALIGLNAYAVAGNVDFYFQKILQGGIRATGTNHIRVRATKGIIYPRSIRAAQSDRAGARLTYEFAAISTDGETAPLAVTTAVALPVVPTISELFTVGPVSLTPSAGAATPLAAVESLDVDFGMNCQVMGADGQAYPTFAGITNRRPNIGINGLDMTALSTFNMNGQPLDAFVVYFRKILKGGTRVPLLTAQHVKLSGTGGMFRPRTARGQHDRPMEGDWNISPVWDGTTDVVAISTASTIT